MLLFLKNFHRGQWHIEHNSASEPQTEGKRLVMCLFFKKLGDFSTELPLPFGDYHSCDATQPDFYKYNVMPCAGCHTFFFKYFAIRIIIAVFD